MSYVRQLLLEEFDGISDTDARAVVELLRNVLGSLPEDPDSVADRMLRARLDAFVLGFEAGTGEDLPDLDKVDG